MSTILMRVHLCVQFMHQSVPKGRDPDLADTAGGVPVRVSHGDLTHLISCGNTFHKMQASQNQNRAEGRRL